MNYIICPMIKLADVSWPHDLGFICKDKPFYLFGRFNLGTAIKMREKLLQIDNKCFYFELNFRETSCPLYACSGTSPVMYLFSVYKSINIYQIHNLCHAMSLTTINNIITVLRNIIINIIDNNEKFLMLTNITQQRHTCAQFIFQKSSLYCLNVFINLLYIHTFLIEVQNQTAIIKYFTIKGTRRDWKYFFWDYYSIWFRSILITYVQNFRS
jgi:hypothetical protein